MITKNKKEANKLAAGMEYGKVYQISARRWYVTTASRDLARTELECDGIWYDARYL